MFFSENPWYLLIMNDNRTYDQGIREMQNQFEDFKKKMKYVEQQDALIELLMKHIGELNQKIHDLKNNTDMSVMELLFTANLKTDKTCQ